MKMTLGELIKLVCTGNRHLKVEFRANGSVKKVELLTLIPISDTGFAQVFTEQLFPKMKGKNK